MAPPEQVVVAGHICLDIFPDLGALPAGQFQAAFKPGQLIEIGPAVLSTGGPVSNTGLALHRLGITPHLIAKVGVDLFGEAIQNILSAYLTDLGDGIHPDPEEHTSYSIIISPPGIDRIFLHHPGANHTFCAADVDFDRIAQAKLFHFGYPPVMRRMYENQGSELVSMFSRAKGAGVTTSLDMAFPDPASPGAHADWMGICQKTLPYVDLFAPSLEEVLFLLYPEQYARIFQPGNSHPVEISPELLSSVGADLLGMGAKIVALKLGSAGLYLRTASEQRLKHMGRAAPCDLASWADRELWAPCFQVQVVGTTGSGDATIAGLLCGLVRGLGPEQTATAAVAVGACNVEAADAISGIQSWQATLERVASGWPHKDLHLDAPGWRYDAGYGLWIRPAQAA